MASRSRVFTVVAASLASVMAASLVLVAWASPQTGVGTSTCMAYRGGRWVAETCAPPPALPPPPPELPPAPVRAVKFSVSYQRARDTIAGMLAGELRSAHSILGANPDYRQIVIPALEQIRNGMPAAAPGERAEDVLDAISDLHAYFHGFRTAYYHQSQRLVHLQAQEAAVGRETAEVRAYYDQVGGQLRSERDRIEAHARELRAQTRTFSRVHDALDADLRPLARRVIERAGVTPTGDLAFPLTDAQRREYDLGERRPGPALAEAAPLRTFPLNVSDPARSGVVSLPVPPRVPPAGLDVNRLTLNAQVLGRAANQTIAVAGDVARLVVRHVETVRAMERARQAVGQYNGAVARQTDVPVESLRQEVADALTDEADAGRTNAYCRLDALFELTRHAAWTYFDVETADLARLVRVDVTAARTFASVQERVLGLANGGLVYLPDIVRELGSASVAQRQRFGAALENVVCTFARDVELDIAHAPSLLKPLFEGVTCR